MTSLCLIRSTLARPLVSRFEGTHKTIQLNKALPSSPRQPLSIVLWSLVSSGRLLSATRANLFRGVSLLGSFVAYRPAVDKAIVQHPLSQDLTIRTTSKGASRSKIATSLFFAGYGQPVVLPLLLS